jgi:hypothetical protein
MAATRAAMTMVEMENFTPERNYGSNSLSQ